MYKRASDVVVIDGHAASLGEHIAAGLVTLQHKPGTGADSFRAVRADGAFWRIRESLYRSRMGLDVTPAIERKPVACDWWRAMVRGG